MHLLETTLIRVGNDDYARQNKSYGLTTLRNPHVKVNGSELRFQFKGKSGKTWRLQVKDRRIARIVAACQELPGQELFQYVDENGERRDVTSADVNAYLREITGTRHHGQGFPHLGRHRAGRPGAARVRTLRHAGRREEEHPRRHRARRIAPGQYAHHLPQMLRAPRSAVSVLGAPCSLRSRSRWRPSCAMNSPASSQRKRRC